MQNLSWNERFAIIEHFDLIDVVACSLFHISQAELDAARHLREDEGLFQPPSNFDYGKYQDLLPTEYRKDTIVEESPIPPKPKAAPKAKKSAAPKADDATISKRGRKTHKIKDAYEAIPREPMPVEDFMAKHNVSLSVLRRHKNFDHIPESGQVNVRKMPMILDGMNQPEKVLCIWRAEPGE